MGKRGRRLAYHEIVMPEGMHIRIGVVTIDNGVVIDVCPLKGELPWTEWRGGTAYVRKDAEGNLILCENDIVIT